MDPRLKGEDEKGSKSLGLHAELSGEISQSGIGSPRQLGARSLQPVLNERLDEVR